MATIAKMIKNRIMKNTPVGVVAGVIGLAKDKRAEFNSRQSQLASQKKLAQKQSKTGEATFKNGEWKPYKYGQ